MNEWITDEDLIARINMMVYGILPSRITVGQMSQLTSGIYDQIKQFQRRTELPSPAACPQSDEKS